MDGSHDPFIEKFFSRIPRDLAATFTPDQLHAVKLAFGTRSWRAHAIDVRKSLPLLRHRVYFVLLMGRERREAARLHAEGGTFTTLGNLVFTLMFLASVLGPLLFAFYLLKSLIGIDFIPDGGLRAFWDDLMRQLDQLRR